MIDEYEKIVNEFIKNNKNLFFIDKIISKYGFCIIFENDEYLYLYYSKILQDKIDINVCTFNSGKELLEYVREVKTDHAINYEIKDMVQLIISLIYKHKIVLLKDIQNIK